MSYRDSNVAAQHGISASSFGLGAKISEAQASADESLESEKLHLSVH
jgi:hypothetical protein